MCEEQQGQKRYNYCIAGVMELVCVSSACYVCLCVYVSVCSNPIYYYFIGQRVTNIITRGYSEFSWDTKLWVHLFID